MMGMDGVEVTKRLRADKATMHIPVITLSVVAKGWATQGVVADGFLDKPFDLAALYAVVATWMPPAGRAVVR
jgi:CheY-like chemotaxis protein